MLRDTFTWQLYSTGICANELDKRNWKNDNQDFKNKQKDRMKDWKTRKTNEEMWEKDKTECVKDLV